MELATPGSAVRLAYVARHVTDCATPPGKLNFIFANSADPDEMPHHAPFHLGLHCLQEYLFRGLQS